MADARPPPYRPAAVPPRGHFSDLFLQVCIYFYIILYIFMYFYIFLLIFIDFYIKSYINSLF